MILTIAGSYMYPPVPSESNHADLSVPIETAGWVPSYTLGWYQQVGGVQLAVFAYGGAMIFPEFMAEMRRPRDFWKAALGAQLFCYVIYMMFGLLLYAKQGKSKSPRTLLRTMADDSTGQYTSILPGLNFDNQAFILANNIFGLITIMVAAVLYGNIGVKVFYQNVLREYFHAPSMFSDKGRWYWSATVIAYWAVAWLIGTAIPSINALVTLVGAACILQFTYTFPPILALGYWVQIDAGKADNPWAPGMAANSNRIDTWRDKSRWVRGFKKYWYVKVFLVSTFLVEPMSPARVLMAGLSSWSSSLPGPTARWAFMRASKLLLRATRRPTTSRFRALRRTIQVCKRRASDENHGMVTIVVELLSGGAIVRCTFAALVNMLSYVMYHVYITLLVSRTSE